LWKLTWVASAIQSHVLAGEHDAHDRIVVGEFTDQRIDYVGRTFSRAK
jgi:hypothetical protein